MFTLSATDSATGTSDGIIYGFNNAPESSTDTTLSAISTYFRIDETSGEVFMCCNKLDYEVCFKNYIHVNQLNYLNGLVLLPFFGTVYYQYQGYQVEKLKLTIAPGQIARL